MIKQKLIAAFILYPSFILQGYGQTFHGGNFIGAFAGICLSPKQNPGFFASIDQFSFDGYCTKFRSRLISATYASTGKKGMMFSLRYTLNPLRFPTAIGILNTGLQTTFWSQNQNTFLSVSPQLGFQWLLPIRYHFFAGVHLFYGYHLFRNKNIEASPNKHQITLSTGFQLRIQRSRR